MMEWFRDYYVCKYHMCRCDPDKNVKCPKTSCYRKIGKKFGCRMTFHKEYKMNIFKRLKEVFKYGKSN